MESTDMNKMARAEPTSTPRSFDDMMHVLRPPTTSLHPVQRQHPTLALHLEFRLQHHLAEPGASMTDERPRRALGIRLATFLERDSLQSLGALHRVSLSHR